MSVLNLLGHASKASTDSAKVDTHVDEYRVALQNCLRQLRAEDEAVRDVPYTKQLARQLRDDTFRPDSALRALRTNPTLSAGIMESALELLNRYGALDGRRPPAEPGQSHFFDAA